MIGALLLGCPQPSPARVFERDVVPALERSCTASTCHGVLPDAEARGEVIDWTQRFFEVDANGKILDVETARTTALGATVTDEDPVFSTLLRKPLAAVYGGLPHFGGENWLTPDDPDYRAVYEWLKLESEAGTAGGENQPSLDDLEQQFADDVQPTLGQLGCMSGNCHGLSTSVAFRLDPGVGGEFSRANTRDNYAVALTMLSLDGDPSQSRLIRKALPLHRGGILHKGGAETFLQGPDDPRALAIEGWACAIREAETGEGCDTPVESFVFVRGPLAPEPVFTIEAWNPGTDLWLASLDGGTEENLTATLHTEPADIRDPSISPDGRTAVFAMRTASDDGHRLYTLDLDTREVEQLTTGPGTDRDPAFGAGGVVWFVSDRAGVVADDGNLDADLYTVDPATLEVERRSWTPHVERKPVAFTVGQEAAGEIGFTALRDLFPDQARAHSFRFPDGLKTEYHQHFGITPPEDLFHDIRELPDGRYLTTIGMLDGPWGGVRLGIVDRNLGPEINSKAKWQDPAFPIYREPLARLDPEATASGVTGSLYRDPAPLPDGRILAAWAGGPLDLDAVTEVDTAIVVLTLEEAPDGSGPTLEERTSLVDAPGLADFDPEPVVVRPAPYDPGPWKWDRTASTGILRHQGLPMIDAILTNLPPSGDKAPRTDMVAVRLIEAIPVGPDVRSPLPGAGERATTTSLTPFGPSRVLAEVPLAPDGTFQVDIPAKIAFRIQGLDANGMAVGHPHNRWIDVHPGQIVPQGVANAEDYTVLCAGCHGATDGNPDHAFTKPDLMTTASLTLARYDNSDPRRPLPPIACGDTTRVEVDFARDLQPILDSGCVACHSDLADEPGTWFPTPYEKLLEHVEAGSARNSPLIELLTGWELDASGSPPEHLTVDDDDLRAFIRWIDLGASYVGTEP